MNPGNPDIRHFPDKEWPYKLFSDVQYEVAFLQDVETGDLVPERVQLDKPPPIVRISKGYAFNGPSIPRFISWLVPYKKLALVPSLLHDALYQAARLKRLKPHHRKPADQRFRKDLLKEGMPRWSAELFYTAVRVAGRSSFYGAPESYRP